MAPVLSPRCSRKASVPHVKARYRERRLIGTNFFRLKDSRRIANRYDELAGDLLPVALEAADAFWT